MELPAAVAINSLIDCLRTAARWEPSPGAPRTGTAFKRSPGQTPDRRSSARSRQATNTSAGVMGRAPDARRSADSRGPPTTDRREDGPRDPTPDGQNG